MKKSFTFQNKSDKRFENFPNNLYDLHFLKQDYCFIHSYLFLAHGAAEGSGRAVCGGGAVIVKGLAPEVLCVVAAGQRPYDLAASTEPHAARS